MVFHVLSNICRFLSRNVFSFVGHIGACSCVGKAGSYVCAGLGFFSAT